MALAHTLRPPAPPAARPYSALVIAPESRQRNLFAGMIEGVGCRRVLSFASGGEARRSARTHSPHDIVVLDGCLTDTPVLTLVAQLRAVGWRRAVLVTGRHDSLGVRAALAGGIRGYVVVAPRRNPAPKVSAASVGTTAREVEVLQAVSEGLSNKQIGERLGLSSLTVKSHMARIARKLGSGDRAQLVAISMRAGLIH